MAKNEIATTGSFNLVTLTGSLAEAIAEEMDGLGNVPFDRVKIPSGGSVAFELPGEDDENPEISKELVGVILHHHPANAYWADKYNGGNEMPQCSSIDGKTGLDRETGECKNCLTCPHNQFGSDGAGKACKNIHRCYILRENNPVPIILALPPTSLSALRDYLGKKILLKGLRSYGAVTRITLKKETNKDGTPYSRAVFTFAGRLDEKQTAEALEMAKSIQAMAQQLPVVESEDYNTAPASPASDDFMEVPEGQDADLPFN